MVAKKPVQRKVKVKKGESKIQEENKAEESENEVTKMEVDEPVEVAEKGKLHKVIKKKRKIRQRRKGKKHNGMKFQILSLLGNKADGLKAEVEKGVTTDSTEESFAKLVQKKKNVPKKLLNETYQWEIMLTGIPNKWNGNIEDLATDYNQFNLQAFALKRENWDRQICQVLHLYFKTEEDMKKAVFSGPREVLGIKVSLRVNPVRMIYMSNIPYDINEETAIAELKEALGSGVYDIYFPRNKDGKLLGHAIAYVIDEATHEELLGGKTLNLWEKEQFCCSKEDFFKRFVLNVVSGWLGNIEVLKDLEQTLEASDIQVSVDLKTKKLYFLDESSVEKVLKLSGLVVNGRKMLFSRSGSVRFVMKCITRQTPKSELLKLVQKVHAFNFHYNENRCKATFEVPAEKVEMCKALHLTEFRGRKVEVYECGSEELKSAKERSTKRLLEYVVQNDIKFKKGHRLRKVAKLWRKTSGGKVSGKGKEVKLKKKLRIMEKKLNKEKKIK
ncbi:hypothetical protein R5R35_013159 [Gryllus longicercus]|uniref:Uncharacterized protein n=1 Tax=Gryllus longicercus TaxID=2509291 RepID=A0AAN9VLV8_9ORTH